MQRCNIRHKSQSRRQRIAQLVELAGDETKESKQINEVESLLLSDRRIDTSCSERRP